MLFLVIQCIHLHFLLWNTLYFSSSSTFSTQNFYICVYLWGVFITSVFLVTEVYTQETQHSVICYSTRDLCNRDFITESHFLHNRVDKNPYLPLVINGNFNFVVYILYAICEYLFFRKLSLIFTINSMCCHNIFKFITHIFLNSRSLFCSCA